MRRSSRDCIPCSPSLVTSSSSLFSPSGSSSAGGSSLAASDSTFASEGDSSATNRPYPQRWSRQPTVPCREPPHAQDEFVSVECGGNPTARQYAARVSRATRIARAAPGSPWMARDARKCRPTSRRNWCSRILAVRSCHTLLHGPATALGPSTRPADAARSQ